MSLKNKNDFVGYRVPNIVEFINGFEYEVWSDGCWEGDIEDFCGWYPYKFNQGLCFRDIKDIEMELLKNNIRVKIIKSK